MQNHYEILGIKKDANEDQIKKAYRAQALEFHPDYNPGDESAAEMMKKINEAHEVLSDPQKKNEYDAKLRGFSPSQSTPSFYASAAPKSVPISMPSLVIFTGFKVNPGSAIKVVLLGSNSKNKAKFSSNLVHEMDFHFRSFKSTVGVDFRSFKSPQTETKYQIWDLAGQERFGSMLKSYLRNASLILCFDDVYNCVRQVIQNHGAENLQGFLVSYQNDAVTLAPTNLNQLPESIAVSSLEDPYLAKALGSELITRFEGAILAKEGELQRDDSSIIRLHEQPAQQPQASSLGCC